MLRQLLEDSGLFEMQTPQKSGVVRFKIKDVEAPEISGHLLHGGSIYVQPNDREFRIRLGAFENGRFWLSNDKLHDFVRSNASGITGPYYVLSAGRIHGVLRIIRQSHGLRWH